MPELRLNSLMTLSNLAGKGFCFYLSKTEIISDLATLLIGLFCSSNDTCEVLLNIRIRFKNILFFLKIHQM